MINEKDFWGGGGGGEVLLSKKRGTCLKGDGWIRDLHFVFSF